jgi:hypothetical protein
MYVLLCNLLGWEVGGDLGPREGACEGMEVGSS